MTIAQKSKEWTLTVQTTYFVNFYEEVTEDEVGWLFERNLYEDAMELEEDREVIYAEFDHESLDNDD